MEKSKKLYIKTKEIIEAVVYSLRFSIKSSALLTLLRIIFIILSALIPVISIYLGKILIDSLNALSLTKDKNISLFSNFAMLIIILTSLSIATKIMQRIDELLQNLHGQKIEYNINSIKSQKSANLDLSFFDSAVYYNGFAMANMDSSSIRVLVWSVFNGIGIIIRFISTFAIVAKLNILLAIVVIVVTIPSFIIEYNYIKFMHGWQYSVMPRQRKMGYLLNIFISRHFAKELRIYGTYDEFKKKYDELYKINYKEFKDINVKRVINVCITSLLPDICVICALIMIGYNVYDNIFTIGDYMFYSGAFTMTVMAIGSLISSFSSISDNFVRIQNFIDFTKLENKMAHNGNIVLVSPFRVEFKNVCFKYPETDNFVLQDVSLSFSSTDKIAFVGLNGAGKSTIIKLILRFYDVDDGVILINGTNIKNYDINSLRNCFSPMFQDYVSYAFTLKENISLSNVQKKDDEKCIYDACNRSGANIILEKLGKGLNTYLTREFEEDGVELSGGEWQKISLSRAFFRNSDMLILDEPSSSLDAEAENEIFTKVVEVCEGKGLILISHRLSNIRMVNKIFVIDQCRIIEQGSHQELMDLNGKYAYMFSLQAKKYVGDA